jgi:5-hydroxyisourate hydrolase
MVRRSVYTSALRGLASSTCAKHLDQPLNQPLAKPANISPPHQPMGQLSTHVLDTMHGCPAAGMQVQLQSLWGNHSSVVKNLVLNADGRNDGGPLLEGPELAVGQYRLVFSVGAYFRAKGVKLPEPAFLDEVQVHFGVADSNAKYHVPLLVSPWAYSTYRGS